MPFETEDVEAGVILGDVRCLADIATDPTAAAAAAATTKPSPPSQSTGGNGLGVGAAGAGARARAVQNRDLSRGLKWTTAHLNRKFFCSCQPIDGVQMSDAGVEFEDGDLVRVTPLHPLRGLLFYWEGRGSARATLVVFSSPLCTGGAEDLSVPSALASTASYLLYADVCGILVTRNKTGWLERI